MITGPVRKLFIPINHLLPSCPPFLRSIGKFNPFSLNSSKKADRWRQMQGKLIHVLKSKMKKSELQGKLFDYGEELEIFVVFSQYGLRL